MISPLPKIDKYTHHRYKLKLRATVYACAALLMVFSAQARIFGERERNVDATNDVQKQLFRSFRAEDSPSPVPTPLPNYSRTLTDARPNCLVRPLFNLFCANELRNKGSYTLQLLKLTLESPWSQICQ